MDDVFDVFLGLDKKQEIFNLWYEVTFLRMILNHIVASNPSISSCFSNEILESCKFAAQNIVKEKFPLAKLDFSEASPEQLENKKKQLQDLEKVGKIIFGLNSN